jgi:hypothetical protein
MDNFLKWFGFVVQLLSALIIPFFKVWTNKLNRLEIKINALDKELTANYVKRDEYLLNYGEILSKLDDISKVVYEVRGELKNINKFK